MSEGIIPYEHTIQLYDDTPVTSKPRTATYAYQSETFKQFDKLLEKGITEHGDSLYSSPIAPGKKRNRSIRLCYNFQKLNAKTIPISFQHQKRKILLMI